MGSLGMKMTLSEFIFPFKLMHLKYIIKRPELLITLYLGFAQVMEVIIIDIRNHSQAHLWVITSN